MISRFFKYNMINITPIDDLTMDFASALYKHNKYMEANPISIMKAPRFVSYYKIAVVDPGYNNKIDITGFYNNMECLKNIKSNIIPKRNYNNIITENNKNIIKSLFKN